MTPSVLVPREIETALREHDAVGELFRTRPTVGGFSNLTFFADLSDGQTVVVKSASREVKREDLAREARMLEILAGSVTELVVPVLRAHIIVDEWAITVTNVIPGDLGINVVQTRDAVGLSAKAKVLARLLRAVHHTAPPPANDRSLDIGERMVHRYGVLASRSFPPEVASEVADSSNSMLHPVIKRGASLVHGDFGFHNTIWNTDSTGQNPVVGLLDWEWSGRGNALFDPAWLWWTLQFRQAPPAAWESFVETYGHAALRSMGWNPENVLAVLRAQMSWILSCTEPGTPAELEWCNRITKLSALTPETL